MTWGNTFYIYECPPIDFWEGWTFIQVGEVVSYKQVKVQLPDDFFVSYADEVETSQYTQAIEGEVASVREGFLAAGWEGDGQWTLTALPYPDDNGSKFLYSAKQGNNGTTYLGSPFRLAWLEEWLQGMVQGDLYRGNRRARP